MGMLIVAAFAAAGAGSARADSAPATGAPALRIAEGAYSVFPEAYLYRHGHRWQRVEDVDGVSNFGRLAVDDNRANRSAALEYAVEGHRDPSAYRHCYELGCYDVLVGARRESGRLFLTLDRPVERTAGNPDEWKKHHGITPIPDFARRRVELSAKDAALGLKVYREALVNPPADTQDCADYPHADADRYVCLYLREDLPVETPETPDSLRAGLPALTQPAANYELVLAEEFDGDLVDHSGGCANGMANIDPSLWTYDVNPCNDQDYYGLECFNVENGHLRLGLTNQCAGGMGTNGKFSYRYGYLETRYTARLYGQRGYVNIAMVQWAGAMENHSTEIRYDEYGVAVDSYEALAKYHGIEIDHFEYIPKTKRATDHFHQYANAGGAIRHADVLPRRTNKRLRFCEPPEEWYDLAVDPWPRRRCTTDDEVTVTKGVEWTPRGYRTFVKVDGVHDEFIVLPIDHISLHYRAAKVSADGAVEFEEPWTHLYDGREEFFEYLRDGDADSILEQFAIAHMPADIGLAPWGSPNEHDRDVRARMKVDYIRIFQPRDRYRDMEPVYE